jgi:hypothetical protein
MRHQEQIYIQNDNTAVRNKDMLNVNMSSSLCVFKSPKFDVSGGTKVQCNSTKLTLNTTNFSGYSVSAYTECFGASGFTPTCYTQSDWYLNIYEDDINVYNNLFDTEYTYTGYPSDNIFVNSVIKGFNNLNYGFTNTGTTFNISKPYGVKDLKIDILIGFNTTGTFSCPIGYSATPANDACQKITTTGATQYGVVYTGVATTTYQNSYNNGGAVFYEKLDLTKGAINTSGTSSSYLLEPLFYGNGTGTSFTVQSQVTSTANTLWVNNYTTRGRLNQCGIFASTDVAGTAPQFIGFSHCLNIASGGTYSIGIAGNNYVKFKINGTLIVNFDKWNANFGFWHVFPIDLKSGLNVIELTGADESGPPNQTLASFGAEIYSASTSVLSGLTSTTQLNPYIVFSTKDKVGAPFDIGTSSGYYCPSGYVLNTCGGYVCTKIEITGITGCSGSCSADLYNTGDAKFQYLDNLAKGVYIVDGGINTTSTIPIVFNFTANTNTFTATSAVFKYSIYEYNNNMGLFVIPPVYTSKQYEYSALTNNELSVNLPLNELNLDGDYLIKGFFEANTCTEFLSRIGKKIDTSESINGSEYQLYNSDLDYYFVAVTKAESPLFSVSQISGETENSRFPLYQQIFLIDEGIANANINGFTRTGSTLTLQSTYTGDILVTLNGLTLSKNIDYTLNGQILIFVVPIYVGDIITIIYTRNSNTKLISDTISINTTITSGQTGSQNNNTYYYNTTTNKYEIYLQQKPITNSNIVVILNGITLANNIDYYQSITNPKRIIFIGYIKTGDIITVVYYPQGNVVNGISQSSNIINWYIPNQQRLGNGSFELQYSSGSTFTNFMVSDTVEYQPYVTAYSGVLTLSGDVGTKWYYRVKNKKEYQSMCGDIIESVGYSDTISVIIQSNAINSY